MHVKRPTEGGKGWGDSAITHEQRLCQEQSHQTVKATPTPPQSNPEAQRARGRGRRVVLGPKNQPLVLPPLALH